MHAKEIPEDKAALLAAHALGALEPDEADAAEQLIASSAACRTYFEEALETAAQLALLTAKVEPPPEFRARTRSGSPGIRRTRSRPWPVRARSRRAQQAG